MSNKTIIKIRIRMNGTHKNMTSLHLYSLNHLDIILQE